MADHEAYADQLSKPLQEKLRVAKYLPAGARDVLDVGCADGTVTAAMARRFPQTRFHGIDLDAEFIGMAQQRALDIPNVSFEQAFLRDLLAKPKRYDAVTFVSVLHEFFTYGEGISSVLKAVADAHELLLAGGMIVIRDMVLAEYSRRTDFQCEEIAGKILASPYAGAASDFEQLHGPLNSVYNLNHFLLKYMYRDNWERESREHYVPVTFEQYEQMLRLLAMRLEFRDSYLIDFLRNKWREDFGLTDRELASLRSTGFLAARRL